jgi:teichuronic acid biosynthesis glycosyltransferase TuaC
MAAAPSSLELLSSAAIADCAVEREARPLHILTLTPFYPHARDDAEGCFVSEPIGYHDRLRITQSVLAVQPAYRDKQRVRAESKNTSFVRYPAIPGRLGLPSSGRFLFHTLLPRVVALHRERRIDLIHAHGVLPCGQAAELIGRQLEIPFVVSVHGLDVMSTYGFNTITGAACVRISQRVYSSAQRVICVSEHVRARVRKDAGPEIKADVVHNGVNPNIFLPAMQAPMSASVILSVGNLIPTKGHEMLLRAVADVVRFHPDLTCHIIGDGPQRSRLQKLAEELNIASHVRFEGRQSRSFVAAAMQQCTMFVLPSYYEALGCVYLEAMSCGKPVIGCTGQGIEEIITDGTNGFLVRQNDVTALGNQMNVLLADDYLRERVGSAARQTILQRFTWEHQATRTAALYRECVA